MKEILILIILLLVLLVLICGCPLSGETGDKLMGLIMPSPTPTATATPTPTPTPTPQLAEITWDAAAFDTNLILLIIPFLILAIVFCVVLIKTKKERS